MRQWSAVDIKPRIDRVLNDIHAFPHGEAQKVREAASAGEVQLALENLIVQLDELSITAPVSALTELRELAGLLELKPPYFELLDIMSKERERNG